MLVCGVELRSKEPAMTKNARRQSARVREYLSQHRAKLKLLEKMWADSRVQCYDDKEMPDQDEIRDLGSAFLAGPTSWLQILEFNWRCKAVELLREAGFEGWIYVPESRGLKKEGDFPDRAYIHYWESDRLFGPYMKFGTTKKIVWIPRNSGELLGLNTNLELGLMLGMIAAGRETSLFVGWPVDAARMGLPDHYSVVRQGVKRHDTLRHLCYAVVGKVPPEDLVQDLDDDFPF